MKLDQTPESVTRIPRGNKTRPQNQVVSPAVAIYDDRAFQRIFCDRCLDEVFLERRNFETSDFRAEAHRAP